MHNRTIAGFTMIELLVAIGIFGIFITIVSGIFSRFMLIERHGIAQGQVVSDIRSGMESFVKEARTAYGSTYNVTADGSEVAFRNQSGDCVGYRVADGMFERAVTAKVGEECTAGQITSTLFSPLTSSQTIIDSIHFNVVIAEASGNAILNQGVITISISAKSQVSDILPVELENSITSRQMSAYVP